MADWRDRGFVPDSDDEVDLEEVETQRPPRTTVSVSGFDDSANVALPEENAIVANARHNGSLAERAVDSSSATLAENTTAEAQLAAELLGAQGVQLSYAEAKDQRYEPISMHSSPLSTPPEVPGGQLKHFGAMDTREDTAPLQDLISSSPLSEPPEFLSTPATQQTNASEDADGASKTASFIGVVIPSAANQTHLGEASHEITTHPERAFGGLNHSLRKRNPIQLHPYMLESEQYRQFLKARGLKPLKIVQAQETTDEAATEDSQDQEFQMDDDTQPQQSRHSRPGSNETGPLLDMGAHSGTFAASAMEEDDEFPNVDSLLKRTSGSAVHRGVKRRKTRHTYSGGSGKKEVGSTSVIARKPFSSNVNRNDSVADPGHSFSVDSSPLGEEHITAVTTFEDGQRPTYDLLEDTNSGLAKFPAEIETLMVSSGSASSAFDGDDSIQIRRVQRKIKGVLPASWLKLDQQKRPVKDMDGPRIMSRAGHSTIDANRPGVARPRLSSGRRAVLKSVIPDSPSGSDSEGTGEEQVRTRVGPRMKHASAVNSSVASTSYRPDLDDVEEDNRVDAMLPPSPRKAQRPTRTLDLDSRGRHWSNAKFQPRITQAWVNSHPKRGYTQRPRVIDRVYDARASKRLNSTAQKPSIPRLSILDAPTARRAGPESSPRFIRIAKRQARSRVERGRHSPSRKLIRLANREDTADVESVLRGWREGTIVLGGGLAGRGQMTRPTRQPLVDRPDNTQPTFPGDDLFHSARVKALTSLGPASPRALARPAVRQTILTDIAQHLPTPTTSRPTDGPGQRSPRSSVGYKPGFIFPGQRARPGVRPAQLESTRSKYRNGRQRGAFGDILACVDRLYEQRVQQPRAKATIPLQRFLAEKVQPEKAPSGPCGISGLEDPTRPVTSCHSPADTPLIRPPRRIRKRTPRQLDVDAPEYRITPEITVNIDDERNPSHDADISCIGQVLSNLGPFGTDYTVSFAITPLKSGTFFHESTFIGSGEFARALMTGKHRDMDKHTGYAALHVEGWNYRWGPWSEEVAVELRSAIEWTAQLFDDYSARLWTDETGTKSGYKLKSLLRYLARYVSQSLSFSTPSDRKICAATLLRLLQRLLDCASHYQAATHPQDHDNPAAWQALITVLTYSLVVAHQVFQLVNKSIEWSFTDELEDTQRRIAVCLLKALVPSETDKLRAFYDQNKRHTMRELGIREGEVVEQAWVVLTHALDSQNISIEDVSGNTLLTAEALQSSDARVFERAWQNLFTLLPIQEIDQHGVLETGRRFRVSFDNWAVPRTLVGRVFAIYRSSHNLQPPSFNAYCRALFGRCHHLIKNWGWRRCEAIIGVLFDFFAANNLAHLRHEETWGSPRFLEQLDEVQELEVEPGERCFHIFLKTIGVGLKAMRQIYSDKKIRNIVFRLMPNHGRQYPKEESVHQEDLDSLRNHHDLLTTLYWASPPSCRPSVSIIRDLVHAESSHRQACHVSVRTWANLVRFQLSSGEPASSLQPFGDWHNQMTAQTLQQRYLARSEAQGQFSSATAVGGWTISKELLESTIENNQRQVEAILNDVLVSMKIAMTLAKGSEEAGILLHKASTVDIFDLFDAKGHRTNQLVVEALGIIRAFVQTCQGPRQPLSVPGASEDSQDYGDWSAFEDPGDAALSQITCEHFMSVAHEGLARLVSNAFGADARPDDSLLIEITDTWIAVAALLVQQGMKHWDNFLGTHSRDSWTSLRETEQARQYSVYFLARVLQNDRQSYEQQKPAFLHTWISSLLQRQSMLKYENELTCALIRVDGGNPLLRNLPFWTKAGTSAVQITRTEFSDSRLSLISSVLANMRESLEEAEVSSGGNAGHMRRDYAQLLKSMMSSMKKNYQELAQGPPRNDEYVQFVQKVVDFLQQHTIHICPIDRFFTDSSAFPLPATDPSYVVGRLRHYGLRLSDSRVHKQLVSFVLSVSERAAVDQQQAYLVSQLRTAMSGDFEAGHRNRPTLRAFLMEAVFPAYMELALHTSSSWILARPVLQAAASGAEDLLQDIDGTDWASLQSAGAMITSLLAAMVQGVLGRSTSEDHASQLSVKRLYYVTATSTLPLLDYIHRISGGFRQAVEQVSWLKKWAQSNVEGDVRAEDAIIREERSEKSEEAYEEIRRFNMSELRQTLKQNWAQHSGTNYVIRGSMRKEVKVPLGELEEERAKLKEAVLEFLDVLRRMSGVREHVEVEGEELRVRMPPRESDVPEWMW